MIKSKHNIVSQVLHSDQFYAVNLLSGNADLLSAEEAKNLLSGAPEQNGNPEQMQVLAEKGYLVAPENENKLYRNRYFDFVDQRDDEEVQLFFVPNYSCNFSCSYCYQDEYTNPHQSATPELIHAFFDYVRKELPDRRKYLTIFGGEPLLNTPHQRELIALMVGKSNEAGIDICVVTNGYYLEKYIDLLAKGKIREIQITLDGTKKIHDQRRFLKGGSPTFEPIMRHRCRTGSSFPVNLRMVIDKQNIENLPDLASFAIEKGWTSDPLFKTQIGRNYECITVSRLLISCLQGFPCSKIFELTEVHPHIPSFTNLLFGGQISFENGTLPPLFDACHAANRVNDCPPDEFTPARPQSAEEEALGTFYGGN